MTLINIFLLTVLLITLFDLSGGHGPRLFSNWMIIYVLALKAKKKAAQG
jgi:hypothetical protein